MSSRSLIATLLPAVALTTAGLAATAPAQAATPSITAATAGTKALGATTYLWGTSTAPAGTKVCSQISIQGNWSTSQCAYIQSNHSYAVELTYGKTTPGTYTFRATTRNARGAITATSAPVTLTRGSSQPVAPVTPVTPTAPVTPVTPSAHDYIQGQNTDGYVLAAHYNGEKVYLIQKALGIPTSPMSSTMGPVTTAAVAKLQAAHGLKADGVVDANTFYMLKLYAPYKAQLNGYDFGVDKWQAPSQVAAGATRTARITAMVKFAEDQLGKPYVWGGTGPVGYDCSGLMLQALRAGGYQPKNVSNFTDVLPASDLSSQMWKDTEFPKGSLNHLQVGDMVYYSDGGVVHHVSMYVGGGWIINAAGSKVQYAHSAGAQGHDKQVGVNRMP